MPDARRMLSNQSAHLLQFSPRHATAVASDPALTGTFEADIFDCLQRLLDQLDWPGHMQLFGPAPKSQAMAIAFVFTACWLHETSFAIA